VAPASFVSIGDGAVGRLFVSQERLKFAWTGQLDPALRSQLLNASLSLSDGLHARDVWLRPAESLPAIAVDLERKLHVIPLNVAALPSAESLLLHVEDARNFPGGVEIEPAPAKLRAGERLLATVSGGSPDLTAEIELQFALNGATPEIRLRAWYRASDRREEFTSENASADYALLQRKFAQDQAELNNAQAAAQSIASSIRALNRRTPSSQAERVALSRQAAALEAQHSKALNTIRRLSNTLPKMQAAALHLEAVANLGRQLHQKAQFHARLCAVSGARELTLVRLGSATQP
jgi:hypothetical protein